MHDPIISSRYELHVSELGAAENKAAKSYYDVYPTDAEAIRDEDDLTGYVHSIEVGSTVDGPGIRLVVFLTGCPLRCQYCHNPDTWHKDNGTPYKLSEIMRKIGKYTEVLRISKGGVTISGGEPAVQRNFATAIFNRCKALGLHTCLDTSGRLGFRISDEELNDIDLHLLDIKSGSEETYRLVTGWSLVRIRPGEPSIYKHLAPVSPVASHQDFRPGQHGGSTRLGLLPYCPAVADRRGRSRRKSAISSRVASWRRPRTTRPSASISR
ncbi:MAG: 4Fe-4S cluster-binding domain-containing protein [Xanthobacteraceae bacterium]|nr:4Fe-4S cluster-binding domain-containing protein [Xanthobacteraceae bacterium]